MGDIDICGAIEIPSMTVNTVNNMRPISRFTDICTYADVKLCSNKSQKFWGSSVPWCVSAMVFRFHHIQRPGVILVKFSSLAASKFVQIPQWTSPASHNAPLYNRNVHISVTKWYIVGYLPVALWVLWRDETIPLLSSPKVNCFQPRKCFEHSFRIQCHQQLFVYELMMTSSNKNIFRVTGPLCGEFTGHRWIPHTKASDAELWCFLWSASE